MSAYFAICTRDGVEMVTDGAAYTADGILRGKSYKVRQFPKVNAIATTRGIVSIGAGLGDRLEWLFDEMGTFDAAMTVFGNVIEDQRPGEGMGLDVEMAIAGISEEDGPTIFQWSTFDGKDGEPAYQLHRTKRGVFCGVELSDQQYRQIQDGGGLRTMGVRAMEAFRVQQAPNMNDEGRNAYFIGGHVDLTSVTNDGITQERLHEWTEDVVGERLDPFKVRQNVVGMNRKQRRAARAAGRARVA